MATVSSGTKRAEEKYNEPGTKPQKNYLTSSSISSDSEYDASSAKTSTVSLLLHCEQIKKHNLSFDMKVA